MWGDHPVHGTTTAVRVGNVDLLDNLEESYPSRLEVQLSRSDVTDPWGFAIQGGFDQGVPLSVQRVSYDWMISGIFIRISYVNIRIYYENSRIYYVNLEYSDNYLTKEYL